VNIIGLTKRWLIMNAASFFCLVIDVGEQKLYYTDENESVGKVGELSTDGTGHNVLISNAGSRPAGLVLDVDNRYIRVSSMHPFI